MPTTIDPVTKRVIQYTDLSNGLVKLDREWVKANIRKFEIPIFNRPIWGHKLIINPLCSALRELDNDNHRRFLKTFDGCWYPRHIRRLTTKPLSNHSFGLAFDINAQWNQQGTIGSQNPYVVRTLQKWGFTWGGLWQPLSVRDDMHYELRF